MPTIRKRISNGNRAGLGDFKIQLASDSSGYVEVVAIDGITPSGDGGGGASITPITPGSSSALETSHVLKASGGNLYSLYVLTTSVAGFLMTFNRTTVPADGTVAPIECIAVPANSTASISSNGGPPDAYPTGIVAVFSTTGPFTKTSSATAFFKWGIQ